jgi:hypothetical protein
MSTPLSRLITRGAYVATQLPRVAWYVGHGLAMRQLSERARRRTSEATRPHARTNLRHVVGSGTRRRCEMCLRGPERHDEQTFKRQDDCTQTRVFICRPCCDVSAWPSSVEGRVTEVYQAIQRRQSLALYGLSAQSV